MKAPAVWSYDSYVRFLNDYFAFRKNDDPTFTYSAWSKEVKFRNLASLTRILNGDRIPGDDTLSLFLEFFQWNEIEKEYFSYLVRAERETNADLRVLYRSRLKELRSHCSPLLNLKQKVLLLWGTVNQENFKKYLAPFGFESILSYGATRIAVCLKAAYTTESELGQYSEFNFVSYVKRKDLALGEFEVFVDKIYATNEQVINAFNQWGSPYQKKEMVHQLENQKLPLYFSLVEHGKTVLNFQMGNTDESLGQSPQPNDVFGYNPLLKNERAFRMKLNSTAFFRNFNRQHDHFSYDKNTDIGGFLNQISFSPNYWTYHPDFTAVIYPVEPR